MLSDLLEVTERRLELLDEGTHSSQGCSLELLASVQGIGILEKSHIIRSNVIYDILGLVDVTERQLVMVSIIKDVH